MLIKMEPNVSDTFWALFNSFILIPLMAWLVTEWFVFIAKFSYGGVPPYTNCVVFLLLCVSGMLTHKVSIKEGS